MKKFALALVLAIIAGSAIAMSDAYIWPVDEDNEWESRESTDGGYKLES